MNSLLNKKNEFFFIKTLVLSILLYAAHSFAVTDEDLKWIENKVTNTQRNIDEQTKEDIERGIGNKSKYDNLIDQDSVEYKKKSKKTTKTSEKDNCINVNKIEFEGGEKVASKVKRNIRSNYLNQCLTAMDIESIMSDVVNWFLNQGFTTTRVYLEAQNLTSGTIKLRIQEGTVSDIILEDDDKESIYLPTLFPFIKGNILELDKIEQGIFQANKQRSNNAKMEITPGENAGDSIIIVKNDRGFPLHLNLSIDNHGSQSTGKVQGSATITADNLIGINDIITFTHRQSIPKLPVNSPGKSKSDSIALVVPFGFFTHTLSYAKSIYESDLKTPSGVIVVSSGSTDSVNATVDRVMFRNADTIVNSYIKLNVNQKESFLDSILIGVSSIDATTMTVGSNVNTRIFDNPFSITLDYSRGLSLFGAEKNKVINAETDPVNLFSKIESNISYSLPLSLISDELSLTSSLSGQYAFNNLPSSQRMSIGSRFTVRGYIDNSLSGDNGGYMRNELMWRNPVLFKSGEITTRLNAGYDIGWVKNRNDSKSAFDGTLSGGSLGLTIFWRKIATTISYDFPINNPKFLPRESGQLWWRLNMDI